jgi:hypothetical protein
VQGTIPFRFRCCVTRFAKTCSVRQGWLVDDRLLAGADNNARWGDLTCRLHGIPTKTEPGSWVARRRSPDLYPDAVTLLPHAAAEDKEATAQEPLCVPIVSVLPQRSCLTRSRCSSSPSPSHHVSVRNRVRDPGQPNDCGRALLRAFLAHEATTRGWVHDASLPGRSSRHRWGGSRLSSRTSNRPFRGH